ncbi:MAG TPA: bifunctional UDP-N-acetylglucosamine diphosphorylase/glucosamine-1-phosphate N-acetyltransferase GlmU, partial [Mycobacteriales bacterium]|nr:bifunctional UDP-N-acetylglucosamine diphosphorylase/glucosamine-1-phosphate N-acetyltransferase GlmU [Mycobacteriales bacterium]
MTDARPTAVVVLAAGEGTRMRSATPKVLHALAGRSLVGHVLAACAPLGAGATLVVVGAGRDAVTAHLAAIAPDATPVVQAEQRGTGHAARIALDAAPGVDGTVLVLPGDAPLLRTETLTRLVEEHRAGGAVATVLTAVLPDPTGYGRVLRRPGGQVAAIVEHRDATAEQRAVAEINTSVYAFESGPLRDALSRLSAANAQGEEYLTDVVADFVAKGLTVGAVTAAAVETAGVNDRVQLAAAARAYNERVLVDWMRAGVTVLDPASTWVDADVELAPDVLLRPGVQLHGRTRAESGAEIGPDCTLTDTVVRAGARVVRAHCDRAEVGPGASVGPFAYLRPGATLGPGAKVGTYVEVKGSELGAGAKVPHLSYVGDATVGAGANLGAGTITANYDGVAKHRTTIGEHVRTGSDTVLVAPVTIGDGAYTAAGSVIVGE